MLAASGDQYEISADGYRAVVTECGGGLRVLEQHGIPLVDGYGDDEVAAAGRGQLLVPWPNRVRDGAYSFGGRDLQLPLTEPARGNASHGLVRWVAWSLEEHTARSVALTYRLMAQTGYPWTLDLRVVYDLSADGLTVTQSATNLAATPAPYASGAHPYLTVGDGPVDGWELTLPAATRSLVDDRLLPVGTEKVDGSAYDFRIARPLRDLVLDDAFTDLSRAADGTASVVLTDPRTGRSVSLWLDGHHRWLQVFTADQVPGKGRRSLAVEPLTARADTFRTGEDLVVLEPGEDISVAWGIRSL